MTSRLPLRRPIPPLRRLALAALVSLAFAAAQEAAAAPRKAARPAANPKAASAAPASDPASRVDTASVRRYYLDGDFEPAIALLENTLRTQSGFTHGDSVFMFKHLGVMYAANQETREKGKHYMLRLLDVEPTARILDMYASDMIYMIFKNIQEEFEATRRPVARRDTAAAGGSAIREDRPETGREPARRKSSAATWIGVAAAATAAAGAVTWYYFSDEPKTVVDNHRPQ